MGMLEIHQLALETVNEARHMFLLKYRKDRRIVYGIVEGKDDPMFYRNAIERFIPNEWTVDLIPAGNREKAIALCSEIDWEIYSRLQIAFFIDRDLADYGACQNPTDCNIYITDGYSIENNIVCHQTFSRILAESYNITATTPEEAQSISDKFEENIGLFNQAMRPIMAQILHWRLNGVKCNLNNLNLSPMFDFVNGSICLAPDFVEVDERLNQLASCCGAIRSSPSELDMIREVFESNRNHQNLLRGKYLMWLLSASLNSIHASISQFVAAYTIPPKPRLPVGINNIMVVAAPRARIPESLRDFIERTYLSYISTVSPQIG